MEVPTISKKESLRLKTLQDYGILYTQQEDTYQQLTDLATQITGMPVSLISLVDENQVWFKASTGIDLCSVDRSVSLCSHAVSSKESYLVVNDLKKDTRFSDNPFANLEKNPMIFYAGVCLVDENEQAIGTLCVIDHKPNTISDTQLKALDAIGKQVIKLIELHKRNKDLREAKESLRKKNIELKEFAGRVSHDMKMPLANIIVTTDLLKAKFRSTVDKEVSDYLDYLKDSSFNLSDYIDGLLNHYQSDETAEHPYESFDLNHLLEEIIELLNIKHNCEINFPEKNYDINCNRSALEQIFLNLIGNALKYNDKEDAIISIECDQRDKVYKFKVSDNGVGIPDDKLEEIFKLFSTVGNLDREGKRGHGIGLSTVKKLCNKLGGDITVNSEIGKGSNFEFWIETL